MSKVQIVHRETQEIVESIDVTGDDFRRVEKLIDGIGTNLDHLNYFVKVAPDEYQKITILKSDPETFEEKEEEYTLVKGTLSFKDGKMIFLEPMKGYTYGHYVTHSIPDETYIRYQVEVLNK